MQPVSHGNESYNANNPSASPVTVVINYSQSVHVPRVVTAAIIRGWHLFLSELLIVWQLYSLRAPDCVATIFVGSYYSWVAAIRRNMISQSIILHVIAN